MFSCLSQSCPRNSALQVPHSSVEHPPRGSSVFLERNLKRTGTCRRAFIFSFSPLEGKIQSFSALSISFYSRERLSAAKLSLLTPAQSAAIPQALAGNHTACYGANRYGVFRRGGCVEWCFLALGTRQGRGDCWTES